MVTFEEYKQNHKSWTKEMLMKQAYNNYDSICKLSKQLEENQEKLDVAEKAINQQSLKLAKYEQLKSSFMSVFYEEIQKIAEAEADNATSNAIDKYQDSQYEASLGLEA